MTKTELFAEYGSYHADNRNRVCHAIGIPLIVLGVMGMLHLVRFGAVDVAMVASLAVLVYYATMDVRGAVLSAVAFVLLYLGGTYLSWQWGLAAFIVGWVFQLVGHTFEGSKPKFLENLVYLLIGPLYLFEEMFDAAMGAKRLT